MSPTRRTPALAVLALVAGILSVVGLAEPAGADHTPVPTSVTLVGSLQSELGCADDWSPPCVDTMLTAQADGTWAGSFDVPAGAYELKVALNGTWDESYGAGGGSDNIPLVLTHDANLTSSYDHASHQVGLAPTDLPGSDVTAADRALAANSPVSGFFSKLCGRAAEAHR